MTCFTLEVGTLKKNLVLKTSVTLSSGKLYYLTKVDRNTIYEITGGTLRSAYVVSEYRFILVHIIISYSITTVPI